MTNDDSRPETLARESLKSRFFDTILGRRFGGGYDFFISYAWKDGRQYATALRNELEQRGFRTFLDSEDYEKGTNWQLEGFRALKRSNRLLLVVTEGALQSQPVRREIDHFSSLSRPIWPINIANVWSSVAAKDIRERIRDDILRFEESGNVEVVLSIGPSVLILQDIVKSYHLRRQKEKRAFWLGMVTAVMLILATSAVALTLWAIYLNNVVYVKLREVKLAKVRDFLEKGRNSIEFEHDVRKALVWFGQAALKAELGTAERRSALKLIGAWARTQPTHTLIHNSTVSKAVFSPDRKTVLTASFDGTVQIWEAASGKSLGKPLSHDSRVLALEFNADGTRLATGCEDGEARLWDTANWMQTGLPLKHSDIVSSVAFNADGTTLATMGNFEVALWNVHSHQPLVESIKHKNFVLDLAFSPDGSLLATAGEDGIVRFWNSATGNSIKKELRHDTDGVRSIAFSQDGKLLATGSNNSAWLWDVDTAQPVFEKPILHQGWVMSVALSADGKRLATACGDYASLWDVSFGESLGAPFRHEERVLSVAFDSVSDRLLTAAADNTARLWDIAEPRKSKIGYQDESEKRQVVLSSDGQTFATVNKNNIVCVWECVSGKLKADIKHDEEVRSLALNADGRFLVTGCTSGSARVWDVASAKLSKPQLQHSGEIMHVAINSDGKWIATSGFNDGVRLWNLSDPKGQFKKLDPEYVSSMVFSPNGRTLATAGTEVHLWDVSTGTLHLQPLKHDKQVSQMAFSSDGKTLATATGYEARLWNATTGEQLGEAIEAPGDLRSLAFSNDGSTLALCAVNCTQLWDLPAKARLPSVFSYRSSQFIDAVFAREGRKILTASADGLFKWDIPESAEDNPVRLELSIDVRSWHTIEGERIRRLSIQEWRERNAKLDEMGGPCDVLKR